MTDTSGVDPSAALPAGIAPGSIVAKTADGVLHAFPSGTPEDVIDSTIKSYVQQQQPGYQQAKQKFLANETQGGAKSPSTAGAALNYLQGTASFGFTPEIMGGLNYAQAGLKNLVGMGDGSTASENYQATRDATRELIDKYRDDNPKTALALNLAGGLGVGGAAGGAVKGAETMGGVVARSAGTGGVLGAAYGAGNNPNDRLGGALIGGAEGVGLGVAAPVVVNGAVSAGRAVQGAFSGATAEQRAVEQAQAYLRDVLGNDPAGKILADPRVQRGAPFTVAEIGGRGTIGDLAAMSRRVGSIGDEVNNTIGQREFGAGPLDGTNGRLLDSVENATGINSRQARQTLDQIVSQGRDSVNPAYAAIRSDAAPVMNAELQDLVSSDPHVRRALDTVTANTRNAPEIPDATTWLRVRQQLADDVQRDPTTGQRMNVDFNDQVDNAARDLGTAMNKAIPGFESAQTAAAQYKAPQGAFNKAQGVLFGSGNGKQVADTEKLFGSLKTPGELNAAQMAFVDDIQNMINRGRAAPGQLLTPGVQQKLKIAFGNDADKIIQDAQDNLAMRNNFNRLSPNGGSISAEALQRGNQSGGPLAEATGEALSHALPSLMRGDVAGAAHGAAIAYGRKALGFARNPTWTPDFMSAASKYLSQDAGEFAKTYQPPPVASTRSISLGAQTAQRAIPGVASQQGQRQ